MPGVVVALVSKEEKRRRRMKRVGWLVGVVPPTIPVDRGGPGMGKSHSVRFGPNATQGMGLGAKNWP